MSEKRTSGLYLDSWRIQLDANSRRLTPHPEVQMVRKNMREMLERCGVPTQGQILVDAMSVLNDGAISVTPQEALRESHITSIVENVCIIATGCKNSAQEEGVDLKSTLGITLQYLESVRRYDKDIAEGNLSSDDLDLTIDPLIRNLKRALEIL